MRSFQHTAGTRFYAGVELHTKSLYLNILDRDGQPRFGRNLTTLLSSRLRREKGSGRPWPGSRGRAAGPGSP